MNNISLVTNALEYYDSNNEKYHAFLRRARFIKFIKAESDMEHNVIIMCDGNENEFFRSRYEIIGKYSPTVNMWTWGWAVPTFEKNNTNIIRKIWNYGATLEPRFGFLKTELITSRFSVANKVQLDIHTSIASYLSKQPLVYKYYSYARPNVNSNGFFDIRNDSENYSVFYMFLLDYEKLGSDGSGSNSSNSNGSNGNNGNNGNNSNSSSDNNGNSDNGNSDNSNDDNNNDNK